MSQGSVRMEKLADDDVKPGDEAAVLEGAKVSKKVLSPLICFTVTDIVRRVYCSKSGISGA